MSENTAAVLERLRSHIRRLEAQPRQLVLTLRTGVPALDALGVFRLGGSVELTGEEASGRTSLALSLVASACREKRLSAWVDGPGELYPPAALSLGVELERLLIVRPPSPKQVVWSAVQLLRSGAFTCVVLDVTHTGVLLSLTETKKLQDAARTGGSLLVLLTAAAAPAQGLVRLTMSQARPAALRVVVPEDESLAYDVASPHGKRARVQRARLSRSPTVPVRRAATVGPPPPVLEVVPRDSLQRPKKNLLRDGYPGIAAPSRPGRETPLRLPAPPSTLPRGRSWH